MESTSTEQVPILRSVRSRTPSYLTSRLAQHHPQHRFPAGRINRTRSSSSLSLSDINRAAIWDEAHGTPFVDSIPKGVVSSPPLPLPDHLAPSSLSVPPLSSSVSSASSVDYLNAVETVTLSPEPRAASLTPQIVPASLE
jgi:hypothetical protein